MSAYRFVTHWYLDAPLVDVYEAIFHSLDWPQWWRGAEAVDELAQGDADGIGSIRRYVWKSRLPYRLAFEARTTRIEQLHTLEAVVDGDLRGSGVWTFRRDGDTTVVRYDWYVDTTKRWMNLIAPIARHVFRSNHDWLMERGAEGLAGRLGARLLRVTHEEAPPDGSRKQREKLEKRPAWDR
jgi:hypothetical protein